MRDNGSLRWLLGDHLGSTSVTADVNGGKTGELRYHPYGATRYTSGTTPTDRRFTGQIADAAIGLYDYNARTYDPALGRFVQADTFVPSPETPRDLNRYAYAANNPLSFIDPNGHQVRPSDTCGVICYTGTTGSYNVEYASPAAQPLTVGTNQSTSDYYWTAPVEVPGDAGVILRYQTSFEATPKVATVYAPTVQGIEIQNVWRYESGQWTYSREDHFVLSAEIPGTNVGVGIDHYAGASNPEVSVGPVVWGGNELGVEVKALGSGVETGVEYGGAGDFYVITTGDKFNTMGSDNIREKYIQRPAIFLDGYAFQSYEEAFKVFWRLNLARQRDAGFPYTWRSTEVE